MTERSASKLKPVDVDIRQEYEIGEADWGEITDGLTFLDKDMPPTEEGNSTFRGIETKLDSLNGLGRYVRVGRLEDGKDRPHGLVPTEACKSLSVEPISGTKADGTEGIIGAKVAVTSPRPPKG